MRKWLAFTLALAPRFALSVPASMSWVDTMTTFDFFVGAFVIFGGFGLLTIVADYVLPHFMEDGDNGR
jgi:hypothetical protein